MKFACPEVEARAIADLTSRRDELLSSTTSIDLLEVYNQPEPKVVWNKNLSHDSLVWHVESVGKDAVIPIVRVFFVGVWGKQGVQVHPSTLDWLQDRFAVSPLFLDSITDTSLVSPWKTGSASFFRYDAYGKVTAIDGNYRCSSGFHSLSHVWFSYDLSTRSATYFIANLSNVTKEQIVRYAHDQAPELLSRPFAVDTYVVEGCASSWQMTLPRPRNELIAYERHGVAQLPSPAHAFENLHRISRQFHIIYEHLADLEECLEFLLDVHKSFDAAWAESQNGEATPWALKTSVKQSLVFLISRIRVWKRWVANYNERTKIRINLFFNLESQIANQTNLQIANLTSKIAIETQRDSSAMITMAAVTMFFLPGTFVSAMFSMVFFHTQDTNGATTFTVSPQWWYYPAVTAPLTILVFTVWSIWRRQREHNKGLVDPHHIQEKVDSSQPS